MVFNYFIELFEDFDDFFTLFADDFLEDFEEDDFELWIFATELFALDEAALGVAADPLFGV